VVGVNEVQHLTLDRDSKKRFCDDIVASFIFMLFLTLHVVNHDITTAFDMRSSFDSITNSEFLMTNTEKYFQTASTIRSVGEIWEFVDNVLVPTLFQGENENVANPIVKDRNVGLFGVRFRSQKRETLGQNEYSDVQNSLMKGYFNQSALEFPIVPSYTTNEESRVIESFGPSTLSLKYEVLGTSVSSSVSEYTFQSATQTLAIDTAGRRGVTYDGSGFVFDVLYVQSPPFSNPT